MVRETVGLTGADGIIDTLMSLPQEVVSRRGGPVKAALRAGALVIQAEARANVQRIMDAPNANEDPRTSHQPSGLARDSIIVSRDPRPEQSGASERYLLRVKRNKYPPQRVGARTVTASKVLALLEQGTEHREPMPWLRPAFHSKKGEALNVIFTHLRNGIDRIVRRLAKKNTR